MEAEDLREPSLNELCSLSVLGNVAFALRCARRMRPKFILPADAPDADKMTAFVDAALCWAEEYVGQGTGKREAAEHLANVTAAIAEATCDDTDFAAYATHHAARGVLLAAKAPEACDQETFMEIVASAYGSSRVLLANTPPWIRVQAVLALRADYVKLLELGIAAATQRGLLLDATEAGPLGGLWPGKTPTW